jgi:hypothetical protein
MRSDSVSHTFVARLRKPAQYGNAPGWGFVLVPIEVSSTFPRRGRLAAEVQIGTHAAPVLLEPDGKRCHWLRLDADVIAKTGLRFGADFSATLLLPAEEPSPAVPADFAAMLTEHPAAHATWQSTTPVAQLDWIHWVESAKQASTRAKRIADAVAMLAEGKKRVCCFDTSGVYSNALSAPAEAMD